MLKQKHNLKSVQGTNDSSTGSKLSIINLGYINDPVQNYFVTRKKHRRSPLINRGYYIRAKAIQFTIQSFISRFAPKLQVLSLGAGFDSTYFRFTVHKKWPSGAVYYEVDCQDVAKRKREIILKCDELSSCVRDPVWHPKGNESVVLDSESYKLLAVDLRDLSQLNSVLDECGIENDVPILVFAECVTTYLDESSSKRLIEWIANKFDCVLYASYEQVSLTDGFGLVMKNHFVSVSAPLLSVFQSSSEIQTAYSFLGWKNCSVTNMNKFYSLLETEERLRMESLELFDEYEEWHLKCNHYVLILATKGILNDLIPLTAKFIPKFDHSNALQWEFIEFDNIQRFAHKSVLFQESKIITTGGFGNKDGCHMRMPEIAIIDLNNQRTINIQPENHEFLGARMHHQMTLLSDHDILVIGGRTSPRNACSETVLLRTNGDRVTCGTLNCSGVSPTPRWRHAAATVTIDDVEFVVVFGGRTSNEEFNGDCFALNTSNWTWQEIEQTDLTPSLRHSHSSVTWGKRIIFTCGLTANGPVASVDVLDCQRFHWLQPLSVDGLIPRYSHSSHVWRDKLILIGGVNSIPQFCPGVAVINLMTQQCIEYRLPTLSVDRPVLLHNHGSVLDNSFSRIIVVGGGGNCFSFGTHFNVGLITINLDQFC